MLVSLSKALYFMEHAFSRRVVTEYVQRVFAEVKARITG
jgi:hypothetical protein